MRVNQRPFLFIVFELLLVFLASAQDQVPSRQTLETMQRHVSSLQAVIRAPQDVETPLKLVPTPVLRYSDPGGITTDASIWIWGHGGRPPIVAGIFFLTQEEREPKWSCELLSLADGVVSVRSAAGWSWMPESGGLKWLRVGKDDAENDRQRLRQMKAVAGQYEVTTFERELRTQLRLMVQPLHRYMDKNAGINDGAIFSYAAGTNPEALLLVESRENGGESAWYVAFARFGANRIEAKTGDTKVWECPAVQKWDAKEPYYSQFGPVERVFQKSEEE